MTACVEVVLVIPDNEALTALATLRRRGVAVAALERADLYRFELAPGALEPLVATLRGFETVYNPNKHALRVRPGAAPGPGEVWVDEIDAPAGEPASARIAGRSLDGVARVERFVAWRLFAATGAASDDAVVAAATETLLCNPAFQKALRA